MAYESAEIKVIVERAVNHAWSIPEFQRGFVWKSTQVRDLAESLWLDYPIGSLLLWDSSDGIEARTAIDAMKPSRWVVDGQQRTAALCILFGRKPYWWESSDEWERTLRRYDVRFDVDAREPPYFVVANAAVRKIRGDRYVPLSTLLVLDTSKDTDQQALSALAKRIKEQDLCHGMDVMEVYTRLDRVRKIRDKDVVTITIDQELEDVVEIFSRLNSRGTRVTEADIYLGVVAAKTPGWVRSTFLPYRNMLADAGFDVTPNLLFRTVTAVGAKKVRFKEIPDPFWAESSIHPTWERTQVAWQHVVARLREYGILSNNPMPTEAALVTLVALVEKFPDASFPQALYWFLQASRFSRYSGSGTTSLEEDLRDINEASDQITALSKLLRRFPHTQPLEADDFLRDYGDTRFGRFLLYLLVYRNNGEDWDEKGHRIGFQGLDLLEGFRPQWHHIFPRKFLEGKLPKDQAHEIDALANIAVIGPDINIRINANNPMNYIGRYGITPSKLAQQLIGPEILEVTPEAFPEWLRTRAADLATAGNTFLAELRGDL